MHIAHISDLHFGDPVVPEVCEALVRRVHELGPDLVVVSGDLTQRAKPREFREAKRFLTRFSGTPLTVPGNHDIPLYRVWERLLSPRALYREFIHPETNRVLTFPDVVLVGLDSSDPYRSVANGRLHRSQLDLCRATFSTASSDAWRVVVLHHHLVPGPTYERSRPMARAKRALETFTELKVDLVLSGHLHRAYLGNSLDVYAGARRDHGIIVAQCGTSTSRRGRGLERESNSFNWIDLSDETVEITHYLYLGDPRSFTPVSHHRFARPSGGELRTGIDGAAS